MLFLDQGFVYKYISNLIVCWIINSAYRFANKAMFWMLWGMSINANEKTLDSNTDASYPDAIPDAT